MKEVIRVKIKQFSSWHFSNELSSKLRIVLKAPPGQGKKVVNPFYGLAAKKVDKAKIAVQWMARLVSTILIRCMVIYPVNTSASQLLPNN